MRSCIVLALISLILLVGCAERQPLQKTLTAAGLTVELEAVPGQMGRRECSKLMNITAKALQKRLKLFLSEEGEIERLNRERGPMEVSPPTYELIELAVGLHRVTDDAWDARSGEVRGLWGFDEGEPSPPDSSSLAGAVEKARQTRILLLDDNSIGLQGEGRLYLRRLAVGRALDEAAQAMIDGGVEAGMITADGIHRTWGQPEPTEEWHIIVQDPGKGDIQYRIDLLEGGLCRIGLHRVGAGGEPQADLDLLDPKTGCPPEEIIGIAAWSTGTATAATFAEAMSVMGRLEAFEWIAECDTIAVFFITEDGSGYRAESDPVMSSRVNVYMP